MGNVLENLMLISDVFKIIKIYVILELFAKIAYCFFYIL